MTEYTEGPTITIRRSTTHRYEREAGWCRDCGNRGLWNWDFDYVDLDWICLGCGHGTHHLPDGHAAQLCEVPPSVNELVIRKEWDQQVSRVQFEINERLRDIGRRMMRDLFGGSHLEPDGFGGLEMKPEQESDR